MKSSRLSLSPGTALAVAALFFALGGSAFAVGRAGSQRGREPAAVRPGLGERRRASHGRPERGSEHPRQLQRRASPVRPQVQLHGARDAGPPARDRRLRVRFVRNGAPNALANGVGGVQSSAEQVGPGTFRVNVYPAGRSDPADLPFVVVLV
jgi:hypothetical protein